MDSFSSTQEQDSFGLKPKDSHNIGEDNCSLAKQPSIADQSVNSATTTTTIVSSNQKIAVIGAGPAGLSCAYELLRLGYQVDIFELDAVVGGMSRTLDVLGQKVDLGPHHFISKYDFIKDFWAQLVEQQDTLELSRLTRIFYIGKFFSYPLKGFEALFKLGFLESSHCLLSYLYASMFPRKEPTFEAWVSNAFGHRLYEIFFKTYSEKLWGIKCTELSDLFAKQRIKSLNLMGAIKNALMPQGKDKPTTLLDTFMYTKLGSGVIYENLKSQIQQMGGQFFMQEKVTKIITQDHKACGIITQKVASAQGNSSTNAPLSLDDDKITRHYEAVVSSAVFTDMLLAMDELSNQGRELASQLKFRNTLLVYLAIDPKQAKLSADHWLYIHSPDIRSGRMCDNANWSISLQNGHDEHVICFEYWANDDEPLWLEDDQNLIKLACDDAVKTGFIPQQAIKGGHVHRIFKSYPIYHNQYQTVMDKLIAELKGFKDLYFIGRNGAARYNNMDHSTFMGLMCARKIAGQYDGDLWEINTDSNYQEILDKHAHTSK